jgi:hypothetical protein
MNQFLVLLTVLLSGCYTGLFNVVLLKSTANTPNVPENRSFVSDVVGPYFIYGRDGP